MALRLTIPTNSAKSRGLKLLFKAYAQQRANFKDEILVELRRLGGNFTPRSSILGAIHRGRVAIFAAMTIEDDKREKVVLKEAAFGERFADQTYQKTLEQDLPPETRVMVEHQYAEVRKVIEQIHLMQGKKGKSLIVRLFDFEQDAELAIQALKLAGIQPEAIVKLPLDPSIHYKGKGATLPETILSGAFGGTLWGTLIGVLAGFGAVATSSISETMRINSALGTWVVVTFSTIFLAAIVGGVIGLAIGAGISEDDTYVYQQSILYGRCLVKAEVDSSRVLEAESILDRPINPPHEAVVGVHG